MAVVTRPAAPAGRGRELRPSPVADAAAAAGIPVLTPQRPGAGEFLDQLRALDVECCAVVAYGALLPQVALDAVPNGWVNLHFSLLPAWRGAAPVQHAIMHGDDITGASTFRIEAGLDTGPVYGVVTEAIRSRDTAGDLLQRLSVSGAGLLEATMDGIADGIVQPRPQPSEGVSLAPKLTAADAHVDWTAPAQHIDRLVRACTPAPGAWTTFRGERLKLGPVEPTTEPVVDPALTPGAVCAGKGSVQVGTATVPVVLSTVQPAGKRAMPAADWARGVRPEPDERLA